jgi:hypothetical protein
MECSWHGKNCPRRSESESGNKIICQRHGNNCPHTCSFYKHYNTGNNTGNAEVPKREIKVGKFIYVIKE